MTVTYAILAGLLLVAGGMCVWALRTGGPGPDWRQETVRHDPEHSKVRRGQDTVRLAPPSAGWLPPRERPGGEAPRLPDHEAVLKARERSHRGYS